MVHGITARLAFGEDVLLGLEFSVFLPLLFQSLLQLGLLVLELSLVLSEVTGTAVERLCVHVCVGVGKGGAK